MPDDNFSQEVIFHYGGGRLSGHAHVNQIEIPIDSGIDYQ